MQKTFTEKVTVMEDVPDFASGGTTTNRVPQEKVIVFKELDQCDEDQHDLHFLIMAYFSGGDARTKRRKQLNMDPNFMREVTVMMVEELAICDKDNFTEQDRVLVLRDSAALIQLSLSLVPKKVVPFFLELMKSTG